MQRETVRRGFTISHQKVVLEIDFSGSFRGYTEITLTPISKDLKTIHLHCRQCQIQSITVASHNADFLHQDPLQNITLSDPSDPQRYPELQRKLYSALAEGDEGELSIAIPPEVSLTLSHNSVSGMVFSEAATPEPQTPGPSSQPPQPVPEFSSVIVNIAYTLRDPVEGFQFVVPTDAYPYRVPHAYTTPSSPHAARCWVPCVDNLWEKCTWELQFVVPRYLEDREEIHDPDLLDGEEHVEDQRDHPTVVVCSGELVEQIAHPHNSNKTIFVFSQPILTSIQHIGFASGPFHVLPIPMDNSTSEDPSGANQPLMHAFCLPGHEFHLSASVSLIRSAMNFFTAECGSYPFGSHKLVFVDELATQHFDTATLSLFTNDLLHGEDAIDQVFETRQALSHSLACQWVGINIHQKAWSDTWLINGLGLYITGLYLKRLFGNNEYRFRLKKDMMRTVELDNGSMPPICRPHAIDPPDGSLLAFVNLKAPLVLHILDRRLSKSGTSLGLSRVLPKVFLSAIMGELQNNSLSTYSFLRTCRKVSGVDPRLFAEQWIYGSGCPQFGFSATFNRKKMAVEISMRQESPAYKCHENDPIALAMLKPIPFFEGQMTVRIHEADGTPYEHVLDIRTPFKRYEVPFNTKYKRVRRNTKRYLARQAAAQAAAEGDTEAAEAIGMIDMGFGLEVWENEKERENWKVADWTEEDEQQMSGATYEWIRMDADFEWIAAIAFDQPDFMWVSQLQRDRDVVAQLEAVHALAKQPSAIVCSTLTKTVLVSNYFFRIRCEAALTLVNCATRRLDFLGLFHLFKMFLRYCYDPEDPTQDLFTHKYVPRPNEFSDLAEYFIRKSIVTAISRVRFEDGKSPPVVRQFLIDQLRYNDNTANPYLDAFYICTIISALACATVSTIPPERGELLPSEIRATQNVEDINLLKQALTEVDRYRNMDRLIPSPHNIVTIAALEWHLIINMANLIPNDPRIFLTPTREGNYTQVRIAAFDGLLLTKWYTPKIMCYVFAVMVNDPYRLVRRHVARSVCESLALLFTVGEIKNTSKDNEVLLIEEDGSTPDKVKESKKGEVDVMLKTLRRDREVGKNEVLREYLMPIALAPNIDHEVRWCMLKLADLVLRPAEEPAPTLKIHIPPTPVTETPPPLPAVKVQVKSKQPLKFGGPPIKSSAFQSTSLSSSLKLKLHPGVPQTEVTADIPAPVERKKKTIAFAKPLPKTSLLVRNKPTPKALAGGMSIQDLRACQNALKKLVQHKTSLFFRQPVDPVRDGAHNYFDIIKKPMDLTTMQAKLEAGMYKNRFAFEADFKLMIENARLYNPPDSFVHNHAVQHSVFFEKQWALINRTLETKIRPVAEAPPPAVATPSVSAPVIPVAAGPIGTPARAMVKLKIGGGSSIHQVASSSAAQIPSSEPKVKGRQSKATDAVDDNDDGTFDILQEVLSMERDKDDRLSISAIKKVGGTKRKESASEESKSESPSKKERLALEKIDSTANPPLIGPTSPKKGGAERVAALETVRTSNKGKEREVVSPLSSHLPNKSRRPPPVQTPINEKKCREVLKVLKKMPEAAIFARPVDPILDGCPTYYDEISEPMDFQTMDEKLTDGKYASMEELAKDVDLILKNCRQFNPPTTHPIDCAVAVEKAFKKEWAKAMEKKLSYTEKRSLVSIMKKLLQDPSTFWFQTPVDPVALGIPMYFDIIPKQNARDLKTILDRLEGDRYDSVEGVEADVDLMAQNAITFNGPQSEVGIAAVGVKKKAREMMEGVKSSGKKRKEGDQAGTPMVTKKVKMG